MGGYVTGWSSCSGDRQTAYLIVLPTQSSSLSISV